MSEDMAGVTIGRLLERAVEKFGDREAYVFEDRRLTFRDLARETDVWARALMAAGVAPGDKVSLMMANRLEWVLIHLAVSQIGAALVPVNTGFRVDEVGYVVGQSDSVMFIVGAEVRGRSLAQDGLKVLQDERVSARTLVVVGGPAPEGALAAEDLLARAGEVTPEELAERKATVHPDDVVLTLYTSGTTGFPKGAMHSHKVIRNMADAADRMRLTPEDTVVLYLPLYHVFGAAAVVTYMYAGGKVVLVENYDVARSLELMEQERATIVYGISTMYYDQMQHEDFAKRDLSSIRLCVTPGTGDLVRLATEKMGPSVNVYGMTETTSMTALCELADPMEFRAETVGKPLPGFEARIVGAGGETLGPDTVGELVVRGHPVMLGYYKKPEATAEVLDADGWFRTGDAASLTPEGYVRYAGRIKEILRVGGENVDPIEVETVLMRHPAVAMASLIGIPDDRLDEVGVAYVQLLRGATATADELRAFLKEKLASFKVPRHVVLIDEFPKTGSGKIQKFVLKRQYLEQSGIGG
ncbi:MAG: Acyl-CoA synthetase (AMP-forming)/AMP-acid ligase [Blastococcus sp.]|nr:Acyl-CoA synthetase (AMP-forming)/AMP-acid ligase [Blastococcus sp.]